MKITDGMSTAGEVRSVADKAATTVKNQSGLQEQSKKRKLSLLERRQAEREEEAKSRPRSRGEGDQAHVRYLFRRQIDVYERLDPIVSRDFSLLRWWKAAGPATLDSNGNILEPSKFPLLSAITSVVHSINSTSCESEIIFSVRPGILLSRYARWRRLCSSG